MHDVERFLDQACCGVGGSHELRQHLRKELREHLSAEIERNITAGMDREEAAQRAIEEFGDPVMIRDGLQSVHGRRLLSLLIEKSMIWKVKTMKTGWKWSFVAHVALVLTIAMEVFFLAAPAKFFLPTVKDQHHSLGIPMFDFLVFLLGLYSWLINEFGWIYCGSPLIVGWAIFEWKCRDQNKGIIRLASLSLLSFIMFLAMALVCVPITIDLASFPGQIYATQINLTPQQAERKVLPKISNADGLFKELGEAIDREDWPAVGLSAKRLSDTCESLHETSVSIMLLAGENQRHNLMDVRDLLDEVEKSSRKIHYRYGSHVRAKSKHEDDLKQTTLTYYQEITSAFQTLRLKSDLFAAAHNPEAPRGAQE